jgi:hypothetical protein
MSRFEYLTAKQRHEQRVRLAAVRELALPGAIASEWRPAPLGRLGRRLWTDIERYLAFVEIARTDLPVVTDSASAVSTHRGRPVAHSILDF